MGTAGTGTGQGSHQFAVALAIATVLLGALLAAAPAGRADAAPVGCTSDFYAATNTTSITRHAADGSTSIINTGALGVLSVALNPIDGYLYAISNNASIGNHLFKVEADGSSMDLGAIAGLPNPGTFPAMGIGPDGILWISIGNLYRIDMTATPLTATPFGTGVAGDIAFVDGEMYASGNGNRLSHFHVDTRVTTFAPVPPTFAPGAMWSAAGHLYANQGTNIVEILGYDTTAPTLNTVATFPAGDGASCATAPSPFLAALDDDYSALPIDAAAGGTTASVFDNDIAAGAAIAAASVTPTLKADGGLAGVTLAADGTLTVPPGASAGTYTLTYQICLVASPAVCDLASATVVIQAAAGPPPATKPTLAPTGTEVTPWTIAAGSLLFVGLLATVFSWFRRRRQTPLP